MSTKSDEIREVIGLPIVLILIGQIAEVPEGPDMMHSKQSVRFLLRKATLATAIAVAFACLFGLLFPVGAAIARAVASLPSRMLWASNVFRTPGAIARKIAELLFILYDLPSLAQQFLTTVGASNPDLAIQGMIWASRFVTGTLPGEMTRLATKVVCCVQVGASWKLGKRLAALFADHSNGMAWFVVVGIAALLRAVHARELLDISFLPSDGFATSSTLYRDLASLPIAGPRAKRGFAIAAGEFFPAMRTNVCVRHDMILCKPLYLISALCQGMS